MATHRHNWTRYWVPRGTNYHEDFSGFMLDPGTWLGTNAHAVRTVDLQRYPCLVLLGEPGIGKSTEIGELARVEAASTLLVCGPLDATSEASLLDATFRSAKFAAWLAGSAELTLYLDGLDEWRLNFAAAANVLVRELGRCRDHAARLRLRLSCRTADWPHLQFEQALHETWPTDGATGIVELCVLRQADVVVACSDRRVNSDAFLNEVRESDVAALARVPLTLSFLIDAFEAGGRLPSPRSAVLEQGCLRLATEVNPTRRASEHVGSLTPTQRLAVASRIAGLLVFCNRARITLLDGGPSAPTDAPTDELSVADLCGDKETAGGASFPVTRDAIRETLNSALFTGTDSTALTFPHRALAEFLAARWVGSTAFDHVQIRALLLRRVDGNHRVVPALAGTAAWLTADSRVFDLLLSCDPQVLLRADLDAIGPNDRDRIVAQVLARLSSEDLDDSDLSIRRFAKLGHPGLASQLMPVASNQRLPLSARRFAIRVAERCGINELAQALATIALDETDDVLVRAAAARAVSELSDTPARRRLAPLAVGTALDADDELRGAALAALWPGAWTASEVFACVRPPRRPTLSGAYSLFLDRLPAQLTDDDLGVALAWATSQPSSLDAPHDLPRLMRSIAERSWQAAAGADATAIHLGEYVLSRIPYYETPFGDDVTVDAVEANARHRVLDGIANARPVDDGMAFSLAASEHRILSADDVQWLINRVSSAKGEFATWYSAWLLHVVRYVPGVSREDVLAACDRVPAIRAALSARPDSPPPRPAAGATRSAAEPTARPTGPSFEQRLSDSCTASDRDVVTGWTQLVATLESPNRTASGRHGLEADVTALPGWQQVDSGTRDRVLGFARRYVMTYVPDATWEEFILPNHYGDFSAGRAVLLAQLAGGDVLAEIPLDRLDRWAPVLLSLCQLTTNNDGRDDLAAAARLLLRQCYVRSPRAVVDAAIAHLENENARHGRLHCLHEIAPLLDEPFCNALLEWRTQADLSASAQGQLVRALIRSGFAAAIAAALAPISRFAAGETASLEMARIMAFVLLETAPADGWDTIFAVFRQDTAFGRRVIEHVAWEDGTHGREFDPLTPAQVADLSVWLFQQYPSERNSRRPGARHDAPEDSVHELHSALLNRLADRGAPEAVSALRRVQAEVTDPSRIAWYVRHALTRLQEATWDPMQPSEILELATHRGRRPVRTADDLVDVVIEALDRIDRRVRGETPEVECLWDRQRRPKAPRSKTPGKTRTPDAPAPTWCPKEENPISSWLKHRLQDELRPEGLLAHREVEIRPTHPSKPGERTDLLLTCPSRRREPESVRLIVEVKGSWNPHVLTDMKDQLAERYLAENDCRHGIYVVTYVSCTAWDPGDAVRRRAAAKHTLDGLRSSLESQARELSSEGRVIRAFVLDASLGA